MNNHIVGIAELHVAKSPDVITTIGLGSCVGVAIYDTTAHVGGLVHILLPTSNGDSSTNPAKYADTGIPELIKKMITFGARRSSMVAKIAGGANMFAVRSGRQNIFMIGQRNADMCVEVLKKENIKLAKSDTGGDYGRTIGLDTTNGILKVKTIGHGERIL